MALNSLHTIRLLTVLCLITLCCSASLGSDSWDFEKGLSDWRKTGTAFDWQPVVGTNFRTNNVKQLVKLKGFDFNFDGLAHFGMVPDMLQDLKNWNADEGISGVVLLRRSYLQMWEKAWSAKTER